MKTRFILAFISSCLFMMASSITTSATAAIQTSSVATWETSQSFSQVKLRAITAYTSPTDYSLYANVFARGQPWVGPGYNVDGIWSKAPVLSNHPAGAAVGELIVTDPAPGSHCANGRHKWTNKSNVVVADLFSVQRCVTVSGGGGGGGCSVSDPVTSVLSLDGNSRVLLGAKRSALTMIGAGEDGRNLILDEFAVIDLNTGRSFLGAASEAFEFPTFASTGFAAPSTIDSQIESASNELIGTTSQEAVGRFKLSKADNRTAMLIQHQREHPTNENFTPTPQVTFAAQPFADPNVEGQRGFAVADVGESGQVRDVRVWSSDGAPLAGIINSAVWQGLRTNFQDHRRHDHRVYLAFQIENGMLQLVGKPIVTLPLCCGSPPCPPPPGACY